MTKRFFPLLLCLLALVTVGGVYATWAFADEAMTPVAESMGFDLSVFEYTPEEVLPGGDIVDSEIGENHLALIDLILNEKDKGYGLNISNNVVLNKYIKNQGVAYSNQKVSGGNLKFILDPKNNTHGLYYCVEKVSDTLYYAYTFSAEILGTIGGSNTEMVVYRTTLEKTDKWRATTSYLGYAKTKSLGDLGVSADPNTIPFSIDVETWHY